MEDRFRYRWWDYHDKEYTYDVQNLCEMDCFGSACGTDCWGNPNIETADNFGDLLVLQAKGCGVIEQCTGCRDYERKLIYTNDILKLNGVPNLYQCIFSTNRVGFNFKPLNTKYKWSDFFDHASDFIDHCKIVGNIHENKELLEGNR